MSGLDRPKKAGKKCLAAMLLLCIAVCITGCHGHKGLDPFTVPQEFDSSKTYEITFWAKNDTNKTQTAIYEKAIADFEKLYPNITVRLRLYTDYGKIYNDVITNIATGTTPNVCITYPDHIATYLSGANLVVPLEELFADERYGLGGSEVRFDSPAMEEIIPHFLNECIVAGRYYAIPYMRSTEVCYINKTYVEALGYTLPDALTWDFIWQVSEAAMKKDADGNFQINGQKVMIPFIYKSTDNMMIQMLRQKEAGYSNDAGEALLFHEDTGEILKIVGKQAGAGVFSTFKISGYPANFLNAGQCIFAIDSTAGATWMGTDAPLCDIAEEKIVAFETVVMPIPQFDPSHPKMISQGPSICLFNKEDFGEVLASWLFAQYLLTNEVQIAYSETEGYIPVTSGAQQAPEYQDYLAKCGEDTNLHYEVKIKAAETLLSHIGDTFTTPVFNGSASLRDAAGQLIENTAKSARRKETIDDAYLEKLYADVTSLYRLDQLDQKAAAGKTDAGPLPAPAVILLASLAAAWILIGLYLIRGRRRQNS